MFIFFCKKELESVIANQKKFLILSLLIVYGIFLVASTAEAASTKTMTSKAVEHKTNLKLIKFKKSFEGVKPKVTMKAKPSCRSCCHHAYRWKVKSWVNYCPHCHKYNCLLKNPKGVHEKEYTCKRCGADYCAFCGHDKHSSYRIHKNFVLTASK